MCHGVAYLWAPFLRNGRVLAGNTRDVTI
jgi:hypothetical protein